MLEKSLNDIISIFSILANCETLVTRRDRYGPARRWLHDFVTHRYFELIIASIIGLNILAMSLEHWSQVILIPFNLEGSNITLLR